MPKVTLRPRSMPKVTLLVSGRAGCEPRRMALESVHKATDDAAKHSKQFKRESDALLSREVCREQFRKLWFSQLPRITKIGNICGQSYLPILLLHHFYTNSIKHNYPSTHLVSQDSETKIKEK